ncbi:Rieske 2Fe-2S domain-containing protein [Nocardioides hungaricus]
MKNFPHTSYATGWYQIAYSAEIAPGQSIPLRYFDTELACYRDAHGDLHLSDAFCPHLGAHLGHGGVVEDGGIRCPFHGWKWDHEGRNCDIPYSRPKQMGLQIKQWPVHEVNGVAFMWFDPAGEEPTWEPDPLVWEQPDETSDYWPIHPDTSHSWRRVKFIPQVVTENSCDAAHFRYVHGADEVPELVDFGEAGHVFTSELRMRFGGGKESSWATPYGPVLGSIANRCYAVGYTSSRFRSFDTVYTLAATTPVDHETSDHFATVWVPRLRGDGSELTPALRDRWSRQQISQHAADFPVWENMTYVQRPPFARDEAAAFRALRAWCDQFYVSE